MIFVKIVCDGFMCVRFFSSVCFCEFFVKKEKKFMFLWLVTKILPSTFLSYNKSVKVLIRNILESIDYYSNIIIKAVVI